MMDLIVGAKEIAEHLGWYNDSGTPNTRRVYNASKTGGLPIWNEPGLGIVCNVEILKEYAKQRALKAMEQKTKERQPHKPPRRRRIVKRDRSE